MAAKKKNLGRGLSALMGDDSKPAMTSGVYPEPKPAAPALKVAPEKGAQTLPIGNLIPTPLQPRRIFRDEQIKELAESLKGAGLLQPILVRPGQKKDTYEIVAGERRWRAAQKAGLHDIPVLIRKMSNEQVLQAAIIENVQREDLTPIEEAQGYSRLINDFGHKQEDVAGLVGKSRSHVSNMIRLLTLPKEVINFLEEGKLTRGHARALIGSKDPSALAKKIVDEGWNVRDIEGVVTEQKTPGKAAAKGKPPKSADTLALEKTISQAVGLKVDIQHKGKGGKMVLHYKTLDQLDDLCKRLGKTPEKAPAKKG